MRKPLIIIVFSLLLMSFADSIDQFNVFLNQKQIGHWDENDNQNPVKTFFIKSDVEKDTLKFVYWTDSGMQEDSKIELRGMNDSVINFAPGTYWQNHWGTFVFPLSWIKKEVENHKQMKVYIRTKHYGQIDTAHTYQHLQLMGILKFE